jgi:hypothetical protein
MIGYTSTNSLCPIIDFTHHGVEYTTPSLLDLMECVDMAIIHIQVGIGRELANLLLSSTPLIKGGIELTATLISLLIIGTAKATYCCCHQRNHWNWDFVLCLPVGTLSGWEEMLETR